VSRLGKIPLRIPDKVKVAVKDGALAVEGPKGKLSELIMTGVDIKVENGGVLVGRTGDSRAERSAQGLTRRLVINMLHGVTQGFQKTLEINGVGYRADARGSAVHLTLGFSHPILYQLPPGVSAAVDKQTVITITGVDRQLVGEVAAGIRKLRPPEPYKGKGVRYANEHVRRKAGKAGATAGK
jgi:large subunit ribosomal protein L6